MLTPVPYHATALRPQWRDLPAAVRTVVEERSGFPVAEATSAGSGFTGGFASRLVGVDGQRLFVKAASSDVNLTIADCYRREAVINAALPAGVAAPRVRWTAEVDGWVVLGFDDVAGRMPSWPDDLDAVLRLVTDLTEGLTPTPAGLELRTLAEEAADDLRCWRDIAGGEPPPAGLDGWAGANLTCSRGWKADGRRQAPGRR